MRKTFHSQNSPKIIIGLIAIGLLLFFLFSPSPTPQKNQSQPTKMEEHSQQLVQFFTEQKGAKNSIRVYFAFSFKGDQMPMTLGYQTTAQTMKEFLVFHPQISLLTWPTMREGEVTLMQKDIKYQSIDEFLNQPSGHILVDQYVKDKYPNMRADLISDNFDVNQYDYIFTSQAPLKYANNTFYYENIFNGSDASIDNFNQLTWLIRTPQANPNRLFYLSNINVEFLSK